MTSFSEDYNKNVRGFNAGHVSTWFVRISRKPNSRLVCNLGFAGYGNSCCQEFLSANFDHIGQYSLHGHGMAADPAGCEK